MYDQANLLDIASAISLPESESGPTHCAPPAGKMDDQSGPVLVRASLSARQAKELGLLTSGTYGQHSSISLASAILQSSLENKLRARTQIFGSTLYKLTWKPWVTPSGAIAFPSAGVGAPHIRDRTYWAGARGILPVARGRGDPSRQRLEGFPGHGSAAGRQRSRRPAATPSLFDGMAYGYGNGLCARSIDEVHDTQHHVEPCGGTERLADANSSTSGQGRADIRGRIAGGDAQPWPRLGGGLSVGMANTIGLQPAESSGERNGPGETQGAGAAGEHPGCGALPGTQPAGPTNGFWHDVDWLFCRDGKWRPVRPGSFPLVNGAAGRVGRLRGYGNAINAEAAIAWMKCLMESI
jgi:hypothetical protein